MVGASGLDELQSNFHLGFLDDQVGKHRLQQRTRRARAQTQVPVGPAPGVELGRLEDIPAPTLLQPREHLKVGIRKDDRESVVRTTTLQISRDTDAAFSVEK